MKEFRNKIVNAAKAVDAERKNFREEDLAYVSEKANEYESTKRLFDDRIGESRGKNLVNRAGERLDFARSVAAANYKKPKKEK